MLGISERYKYQSVKYKERDRGMSAVCCFVNSAFGLTEEHRQKYKNYKNVTNEFGKILLHASTVVTTSYSAASLLSLLN
jgi:phenolic acid decarboxylase